MSRLVIIVTGSRHWQGNAAIEDAFTLLAKEKEPDLVCVFHGNAPGADAVAAEVAAEWGITALPFSAQWKKLGKAAGPTRNAAMIKAAVAFRDCGWDVVGLAFPLPDSLGTWDCVNKMKAEGIPVTVEQ